MKKRTFVVSLAYETYEIINDTLAEQIRYEESTDYREDTGKCEIIAELPSKKCLTLRVGLDKTTDDVSARIMLEGADGKHLATIWDDTFLPWKKTGSQREFSVSFESDGIQYEAVYQTEFGLKKTKILTASGKHESKTIQLYGSEWLD